LRLDFFNRRNLFDTFKNTLQDIEDAIYDFTCVLGVITKQSDPYNWADAHYERAFTRSLIAQNDRKQQLTAVLEDYYAALEVFTYEEYSRQWAEIQLKIAITIDRYTIENDEQDALRALKHIDAALPFYTRKDDPLNYHRALGVRAIMYERLGRWEEARDALIEARAVQRDLIIATTRDSDLHKIVAEFARPEVSLRHAQIALRIDPPDYEDAVRALEEGRTQAMRLLSANLQQQEQADGSHPLQGPELVDIASCITDANMALVYLAAGTNIPVGSSNRDDRMPLGVEKGLALIVTKENGDTVHIEHLPLPHLTSLALSMLLKPVFEPETNRDANKQDRLIPIKLEHTITKLGEMGLNELAQALYAKGIEQVTFVLYSSLGLFPLPAAQVTLQNGEKHYLGELFEINIAPSAYAARLARKRALAIQELKTVLSAGNPKPTRTKLLLPYAQKEAQRIHNIAVENGYQAHYLKPTEITKEQVLHVLQRQKNSPAGYMYAHLAIHGIYEPDDLRKSRLILAGTDMLPEEHCILLGEVLDGTIDLSGIRLLVLSVCQTSVIDIQQIPNEAVGIASAFLQAGAVGVIASFWQVDDLASYLLMTRFAELYLSSHGKLSPAKALAEAQRWLREKATYRTVVDLNPVRLSADLNDNIRSKIIEFRNKAKETPDDLPFAHPKDWAAFIVTGY
jgi:CHAT domain-containing protein